MEVRCLSMILRANYNIPQSLIQEALDYAVKSRAFTSNRHDFHNGGLNNKQQKMFEGKLGEKIVKLFLQENSIIFEEDNSDFKEADLFDFKLPNGYLIDVKTRTKDFHIRTLELVEQFQQKPKDIYISVRLNNDLSSGHIVGWFSKKDLLRINRIENHGYLDNYTMYDKDLRNIKQLYDLCLKDFVFSP